MIIDQKNTVPTVPKDKIRSTAVIVDRDDEKPTRKCLAMDPSRSMKPKNATSKIPWLIAFEDAADPATCATNTITSQTSLDSRSKRHQATKNNVEQPCRRQAVLQLLFSCLYTRYYYIETTRIYVQTIVKLPRELM